ncbi:hypothetical protein AC478_02010, partial [miscellaneous Crenarchaeota group-1 archaeon SG8-32-3]
TGIVASLPFLSICCFELGLNIKQYMYTQVYHKSHKTKKILGLREISPQYMDAIFERILSRFWPSAGPI